MRFSARSATIASATPPPVARHSSTTTTVPTSAACARIASSGERAQPAQVEHAGAEVVLLGEPLRAAWRLRPQPVGVADEQDIGVLVRRAVDADLAGQEHARAGAGSRLASRRRPRRADPSRGRARSARGRRTTRPSSAAIATAPRSMRAASSPRDGTAITRPGMSRSAPIELSLWKWPPKPFWYAEPGDAHDHRVAELAVELKNCSDAASPRSWSSALWK